MQACILRPKRMYPVRQIFTPGMFGTEFKAEKFNRPEVYFIFFDPNRFKG